MSLLDSLKNAIGNRRKGDTGDPDEGPGLAESGSPPDATESPPATYTVQSGDTLWKIARDHYGDGDLYLEIFEANRDVLAGPDRIFPGQELVLPPRA